MWYRKTSLTVIDESIRSPAKRKDSHRPVRNPRMTGVSQSLYPAEPVLYCVGISDSMISLSIRTSLKPPSLLSFPYRREAMLILNECLNQTAIAEVACLHGLVKDKSQPVIRLRGWIEHVGIKIQPGNLHQIIQAVVGKFQPDGQTRSQTRITLQQDIHLLLVSGKDNHQVLRFRQFG